MSSGPPPPASPEASTSSSSRPLQNQPLVPAIAAFSTPPTPANRSSSSRRPSSGGAASRRRSSGGPAKLRRVRNTSEGSESLTSPSSTPSTSSQSCRLCYRTDSEFDELLRSPSGLVAHFHCLLFSSGLGQSGSEDDAGDLRGFAPADVRREIARGARLKCAYCKEKGATVGCAKATCKKSYHLPCGMRNKSLQQYFDQFMSFCSVHRPVQKAVKSVNVYPGDENKVCGLCSEAVEAKKPTYFELWSPCCGAYHHRSCLQKEALKSVDRFDCPRCEGEGDDDPNKFVVEMRHFGIFIPLELVDKLNLDDRAGKSGRQGRTSLSNKNAAATSTDEEDDEEENEEDEETEEDFILKCSAHVCFCDKKGGRKFRDATNDWNVQPCHSCRSRGIHPACGGLKEYEDPCWYCYECRKQKHNFRGGAASLKLKWGTAKGFKDGGKPRSFAIEKEELSKSIEEAIRMEEEKAITSLNQTPPSSAAAFTSASNSARVIKGGGANNAKRKSSTVTSPAKIIRSSPALKVRKDLMNVTLEDLIVKGLDGDNGLVQPPHFLGELPPALPIRVAPQQPKPPLLASNQRLELPPPPRPPLAEGASPLRDQGSPGDSDYESARETNGRLQQQQPQRAAAAPLPPPTASSSSSNAAPVNYSFKRSREDSGIGGGHSASAVIDPKVPRVGEGVVVPHAAAAEASSSGNSSFLSFDKKIELSISEFFRKD